MPAGTDDDLFAAALNDRLAAQAPLAARLRPQSLDEVVGQNHLLAPGPAPAGPHRGRPPVVGDPLGAAGDGQDHAGPSDRRRHPKDFVPMSAVTAGVKDVRDTVAGARRLLAEQGRGTILFLDEVHRFNRTQQDALLPSVEDGTLVLVGATTENPFFSVNAPLLSRSTLFRLEPLDEAALTEVVSGPSPASRPPPTTTPWPCSSAWSTATLGRP